MFVNIYVCFCVVVYALHARTIFATALWLIVSPFKLIKSTFIIYLLLLKLKLLRLPFPFLYLLLLRRVFIYLNLCHIFPDFSPNACMSVRCICCCRKISIKLLYACDTRPQSDWLLLFLFLCMCFCGGLQRNCYLFFCYCVGNIYFRLPSSKSLACVCWALKLWSFDCCRIF